jgi:hypothetical protein
MNYFAKMDTSMVVGHFKATGSADPEVVRTTYMNLVSQMKLVRTILLAPLILGSIQIAVGIVTIIILVGLVLLIPGLLFTGIGWWGRKRLAENIAVAEAAYTHYAGTLAARPASA